MLKKIFFVAVFLVSGCATPPTAVRTTVKKVETQTKKGGCIIPQKVKSGENYYCEDKKNIVLNYDNTDSEISY